MLNIHSPIQYCVLSKWDSIINPYPSNVENMVSF